jgi:L-seryl-tRNA(Ser) seleniumtransferase
VLAGRADLVAACARHPLYRVVRPGPLVLSALEAVALAYLDRRAHDLPFWRMATAPVAAVQARADSVVAAVAAVPGTGVTSGPCASVAGGGSLPGVEIPSWGLHVEGDHAAVLRSAPTPIIATTRQGKTVMDLRTVDPADDGAIAAALATL